MNDLINIDFGLENNKVEDVVGEALAEESSEKPCFYKRKTKVLARKAISETNLMDVLDKEREFKAGYSYHFLTAGDIDILSFLKFITRYADIDYLVVSTWCMAVDDIKEFEQWLAKKKIKKILFCLGEIFKGSYSNEYILLKELREKYDVRLTIFKNHSKVITGYSKDYYFTIESSANINTNPRTENAVLTVDKKLFEFYNDYYSKINSFDKEQ